VGLHIRSTILPKNRQSFWASKLEGYLKTPDSRSEGRFLQHDGTSLEIRRGRPAAARLKPEGRGGRLRFKIRSCFYTELVGTSPENQEWPQKNRPSSNSGLAGTTSSLKGLQSKPLSPETETGHYENRPTGYRGISRRISSELRNRVPWRSKTSNVSVRSAKNLSQNDAHISTGATTPAHISGFVE
jgi:hypothetical protein